MEGHRSDLGNNIERVPKLLTEVESIDEGGVALKGREDIDALVEFPLVDACRALYDKNIETWQSSANKKDIERGEVSIIVVYDSLSEENKAIAKQFGEPWQYDETELITLSVPVSSNTTVAEIQSQMGDMVNQFKPQPAIWVEARTLEDFKEIYGSSITAEDLIHLPIEGGVWYLDEDTGLYYPNEELFKKATQST